MTILAHSSKQEIQHNDWAAAKELADLYCKSHNIPCVITRMDALMFAQSNMPSMLGAISRDIIVFYKDEKQHITMPLKAESTTTMGSGAEMNLMICDDGEQYVLKRIDASDNKKNEEAQNEVKALGELNDLVTSFEQEFVGQKSKIVFVLQKFYPGMKLDSYIKDNYAKLKEQYKDKFKPGQFMPSMCFVTKIPANEACKIALGLAKALKRVQDKGIAHLDLRPVNFLIDTDKADDNIVLIDFGTSRFKENDFVGNFTPDSISGPYMPKTKGEIYNCTTDIYALGEIFTQDLKLLDLDNAEANIELKELIAKMKNPDQAKRVPIDEVIASLEQVLELQKSLTYSHNQGK